MDDITVAPAAIESTPVQPEVQAATIPTPTTSETPAPTPEVSPAPIPEVPPTADAPTPEFPPTITTDPTPDTTSAPEGHMSAMSIINGNKGLIIAVVLVLVAAVIGVSAFIGFSATDQYEGLIKRVEDQTANLKARTQ